MFVLNRLQEALDYKIFGRFPRNEYVIIDSLNNDIGFYTFTLFHIFDFAESLRKFVKNMYNYLN